jgi:hypothetical protein
VTTCESDTSTVIRPALGQHKERSLVVSGKAGTMNHRRAWMVHAILKVGIIVASLD